MHAIETTKITKRFGKFTAVDSLTFTVDHGEVFGLLGPNGAGKTTLIKMFTTLLPLSSGSASVARHDVVKDPSAVRRSIGYVPQMISIDGTLTGYENVLFVAKLYGLRGARAKAMALESMEFMGLSDVTTKLVRQYSGGMIRRLEIAQSLVHRPPVMFLDEPTVGLDPLARQMVWDHIFKLRKDFGTTILLTTHLMEEADALCGKIAIMHLGKIVALDTPEALKASIGKPDACLNDVFIYYAKSDLEVEGDYRDIARSRRTAKRLG